MSLAQPLFFGRSRIKLENKVINCPHCGKIISKDFLNVDYVRPKINCPECGSQRNCKDGKRQTRLGKIQCYLCNECGYRFSCGPARFHPTNPLFFYVINFKL